MAYAPDTFVEASSLKPVLDLAANPPEHPDLPERQNVQPLVLYIARVPGSRDVFLTPMKPREKVVTAEDVQSSLYYVHLSCAEDYEPPPPRPTSANANADQLFTDPVRRKKVPPPLPKRRDVPSSNAHETSTPPYPVDDPMPTIREQPPVKVQQAVSRKPVLSDITNKTIVSGYAELDLPVLPPRPSPAVPKGPPLDQASLYADNIRLLRSTSHLDEHENPYARNFATHPETIKQRELEHAETLRKLELEARPEMGSLTLIRRDPASSQQWNVASVYDPPVQEVRSSTFLVPTAKKWTKKGGTPVYLDIMNPGYAQFIGPTNAATTQSRPSISSQSSESSDPPPEGTFRRRLYMPGSRYADHNYAPSLGHRAHSSLSAASGDTFIRQTMRDERHSIDMGAISDRRTKGYTFLSPWDGTCEFTTGATGRSLKCRHCIRNTVEEVSELRFNLPTSSKTAHNLTNKHSSYFGRHRHSSTVDDDLESGSQSPTIMLTEDGRIDLSLGQERAGGGFGGKQAKLGKLIIEPEGVKMLDLLVAANVGLWWRAWERV